MVDELSNAEWIETEQPIPLPFVRIDPLGVIDLWYVEPLGHNETDFARGVDYANAALEFAKELHDWQLLEKVIGHIVRRGTYGPIESGFISRLSRCAHMGAMN